MAQPYVTGPCAFYVGVGPANAPLFLGHTEAGFQIRTDYRYRPIMNDLSGTEIPLTKQQMGFQAFISGMGPFTRWNEATAALLEARQGGGTRGAETFGSQGAIMDLEGIACPLYLLFPYSAKAAMRNALNGILETGRRYPFACLEPSSFVGGTRHAERNLSWHCLRSLAPPPAVPGSFVLWDNLVTGLPPIN